MERRERLELRWRFINTHISSLLPLPRRQWAEVNSASQIEDAYRVPSARRRAFVPQCVRGERQELMAESFDPSACSVFLCSWSVCKQSRMCCVRPSQRGWRKEGFSFLPLTDALWNALATGGAGRFKAQRDAGADLCACERGGRIPASRWRAEDHQDQSPELRSQLRGLAPQTTAL